MAEALVKSSYAEAKEPAGKRRVADKTPAVRAKLGRR
jgi:hypothetical protein